MTPRWRSVLLAASGFALVPALWRVVNALPPFGGPIRAYGRAVNDLTPNLREITNMVAAVNFDIRGIDTLGEESMLLAAVTGAVVLLRGGRGEGLSQRAGQVPGRPIERRTDATIATCRALAFATLLFGIYVALHGTATPGGGFQGGVIIATSFVVLYLGEGYAFWRRMVPGPFMAILEGGGAFAFVMLALLPLTFGRAALENVLPLGTMKDVFSGGSACAANLAVAVSVAGSFALLLLEFLEETRAPENEPSPQDASE